MTPEADPPFGIRTRTDGVRTILEFEGELDLVGAPEASEALTRALDEGRFVVLDLRALRFIDSSGLRVILQARQASVENGGRLVVVPNDGVRRVFELSGVQTLIELVDAPEEVA